MGWRFLASTDRGGFILHLHPHLLHCSEPPEAHINNQHDEEDPPGSQLGIGGAGVQVLGVTPVLLGQAGQVAGLGV